MINPKPICEKFLDSLSPLLEAHPDPVRWCELFAIVVSKLRDEMLSLISGRPRQLRSLGYSSLRLWHSFDKVFVSVGCPCNFNELNFYFSSTTTTTTFFPIRQHSVRLSSFSTSPFRIIILQSAGLRAVKYSSNYIFHETAKRILFNKEQFISSACSVVAFVDVFISCTIKARRAWREHKFQSTMDENMERSVMRALYRS